MRPAPDASAGPLPNTDRCDARQALLDVFQQTLREQPTQPRFVARLAAPLLVLRFMLTEPVDLHPKPIDADPVHGFCLEHGWTPLAVGERLQRQTRGDGLHDLI